jgi:hypothetical protein
MNFRRLNARGFSHDVMAVAFVVVFALAGVGYLVASHADAVCYPSSVVSSGAKTCSQTQVSATGTINVAAYAESNHCLEFLNATCLVPSNADLYIKGYQKNEQCDGLSNSGYRDFRQNRTVVCTPGPYTLHLNGNVAAYRAIPFASLNKLCAGKTGCSTVNEAKYAITAVATDNIFVTKHGTVKANLASNKATPGFDLN